MVLADGGITPTPTPPSPTPTPVAPTGDLQPVGLLPLANTGGTELLRYYVKVRVCLAGRSVGHSKRCAAWLREPRWYMLRCYDAYSWRALCMGTLFSLVLAP